ncbi:hypothetical protein P3S67_016244 [Capsicum chacoense]
MEARVSQSLQLSSWINSDNIVRKPSGSLRLSEKWNEKTSHPIVVSCRFQPRKAAHSDRRVQLKVSCSSHNVQVRAGDQYWKQFKPITSVPAGLHPLGMQSQLINNRRRLICPVLQKCASIICFSALNARCAEGQTQTVTRESSTITVAPVQGKEKSPELDDGGTGFPPRDDDGGGGGGGGGGGNWKGGFFFFGFLAFLGLLKDQEDEGPYRDQRRR